MWKKRGCGRRGELPACPFDLSEHVARETRGVSNPAPRPFHSPPAFPSSPGKGRAKLVSLGPRQGCSEGERGTSHVRSPRRWLTPRLPPHREEVILKRPLLASAIYGEDREGPFCVRSIRLPLRGGRFFSILRRCPRVERDFPSSFS